MASGFGSSGDHSGGLVSVLEIEVLSEIEGEKEDGVRDLWFIQ